MTGEADLSDKHWIEAANNREPIPDSILLRYFRVAGIPLFGAMTVAGRRRRRRL